MIDMTGVEIKNFIASILPLCKLEYLLIHHSPLPIDH